MASILFFREWRSFINQSYAGLYKKPVKRSRQVEDPMAPFGWHAFLYFLIDKLRMTEAEALDYNYIESLNWMSYFVTKEQQEKLENGHLA